MTKILSRKPLAFEVELKEIARDPNLSLSPMTIAKKNLGLVEPKLKCKLCGEILPDTDADTYMKHLTTKHYQEFLAKTKKYFYKTVYLPVEDEENEV